MLRDQLIKGAVLKTKGDHTTYTKACHVIALALNSLVDLWLTINNYHIWSMVGNHFIHVPSTLDVTALCLHALVPHYHSITLFNPLTILLKLYTIQTLLNYLLPL